MYLIKYCCSNNYEKIAKTEMSKLKDLLNGLEKNNNKKQFMNLIEIEKIKRDILFLKGFLGLIGTKEKNGSQISQNNPLIKNEDK